MVVPDNIMCDDVRLLKSDVSGGKAQVKPITVNTTQSIPLCGLHPAVCESFRAKKKNSERKKLVRLYNSEKVAEKERDCWLHLTVGNRKTRSSHKTRQLRSVDNTMTKMMMCLPSECSCR